MKILVINGDCIQVNSSANLCHLAYLRGLVDAGHEITLLSADGKDYDLDPSMVIPEGIKQYTYYGMSMYEKLSLKKKQIVHQVPQNTKNAGHSSSGKHNLIHYLKTAALGLYGVHGINAKFVWRAKAFSSDEYYDYILSISTPASSHLLAYKLLNTGHVKCGHWIQIWEDPWFSDVYGFAKRKKVYKEEKRLLSYAERVCYVSPITLENQERLFPESRDKMFWEPLPAYYAIEVSKEQPTESVFGYFGDYGFPARNLKNFYQAAKENNIEVNICGSSNLGLKSTESIHIYPRMSLGELRPFEEKTSVLVFLCNREGGQIPGKIYQYAATEKTILFILDGSEEEKRVLRDFFDPFNRFVFCENNVEDIRNTIERIKNGDLGKVKNRPLTEFEPVKIVQRILEEGMKNTNATK